MTEKKFLTDMKAHIDRVLDAYDKSRPTPQTESEGGGDTPEGKDNSYTGQIATLKKQLQALQSSNDKLVEALKNLVDLKHYKDNHGKDAMYESLQRKAWDKARAALYSIPDNKPGE